MPVLPPPTTLVIGATTSHCGNCRQPTLPDDTHHNLVPGGRTSPGCGARFAATTTTDPQITADDLRHIRPDLPIATDTKP